jgi:hypothetical protein
MIPAGYVSAAPLVRVLNYAEQNGVPTEPLRRRMQLELDMPVLLDSTVPLITAMNALHELEALGKWPNFSILLGRIVASELSPLHTQLAKSVKTVADWLGVLPPTESLIGDIGNLHMRTKDDRCELIWELSLPQHPAAESVTDGMLIATSRNLDQITIEPSPPSQRAQMQHCLWFASCGSGLPDGFFHPLGATDHGAAACRRRLPVLGTHRCGNSREPVYRAAQ